MKINEKALSLISLVAFGSTVVEGAPPAGVGGGNGGGGGGGGGSSIGTCAAQSQCVKFSIQKTSACFGADCGIQVCMVIDTDTCPKEGPISHLCAASDGSGCAAYDNDGVTALTGKGSSTDCTSTTFDGKCEPNQNKVEMCQEGKPGEKLYWALKDASVTETGQTDYTGFSYTDNSDELVAFTYDVGGTTCSPTIRCLGDGHTYQCANPNNSMYTKTRVWEYTIPSNDGGSCDLCGGPPPTPPISPNPPLPGPPPSPTPGTVLGPTPGSNGDPHFKTWTNEHFEYHGQCDLVLAKDEQFADGLGLDIQLRTKLVRYWSYIRSAAIRIGHDIIELEGSSDPKDRSIRYWYNMQFKSDEAKTMSGFPMYIRRLCPTSTKIEIDLSSKYPGVKISMSTFKEFVKVEVVGATEEAFGNSVGLLGDYKTGKTLARDGETYMHDFHEYGKEWQVSPMEDMLFHCTEGPQFPSKCLEPEDPRGQRRRRLDESNITVEQAESACDQIKDPLDKKDCIYDILATQDLDMAGAF